MKAYVGLNLCVAGEKSAAQMRTGEFPRVLSRACLKNHHTVLNAPLCGILRRNFGSVAPLRAQNRSLPLTKWSLQPGTSIFQTHSKRKENIYIFVLI